MSDFWKDMGNSIQNGMDWLSNKTDSLITAGKDSISRAQLQSDIEKAYSLLGHQFYAMAEANELNISQLQTVCNNIEKLQLELAKLNSDASKTGDKSDSE